MKRAITAAMALGMLLLCACNSILDGEILITSQRRPPSAQEAEDEMSVVTTYSELSDLISDMLFRHEESALVKVVDYAGELSADLERVRTEYLTVIPIGVFALEDMYIEAGTVVSVVELDITLTYRRSAAQIGALLHVENRGELEETLLAMMSEYRGETAFELAGGGITPEEALAELEEVYYANPTRIVMLPVVAAVAYPADAGGDKPGIIELQCGYSQWAAVLSAFAGRMASYVTSIAAQIEGETDAQRFLDTAEKLEALVEYDAAAGSVAEYSRQSFAATAYGALSNGVAIGEGYAMAYKALCDELGLDCRVVRGEYGGRRYVWNIVLSDGEYYHVDTARCDVEGFETAFFAKDAAFASLGYVWDADSYPQCAGKETYTSVSETVPGTLDAE